MSYQSCGKCHVVRDGSEEVVPGLDMTTDKDQPVVLAMGNEPAGSKVAQLKNCHSWRARTALQNAKSAGPPYGVITSL